MRDVPGEAPEETGRRELAEEAGLVPGAMVHLLDMLPSPGMTDSVCNIYLATDCTPVERHLHGPEENHSSVFEIPLAEALAMVDRGEIDDAKTVIGLLMVERRLRGDAR
jgi:ADP-ribose pyrophosphatase